MATRSMICVKDDAVYKAVYCHWDGYPEGVGKTLNSHYDKYESLGLIELGDISSLGDSITSTYFYSRDRGDAADDVSAIQKNTIEDILDIADRLGAEYVYLFDEGEWLVYDMYENKKFVPLIKVLKGDYMKDRIENILKNGKTFSVTFNKKDGSKRVMRATTNATLIPPKPVVEGAEDKPKRTVAANPDVAKVYDLDIGEWRSFRYDSVISIVEE